MADFDPSLRGLRPKKREPAMVQAPLAGAPPSERFAGLAPKRPDALSPSEPAQRVELAWAPLADWALL